MLVPLNCLCFLNLGRPSVSVSHSEATLDPLTRVSHFPPQEAETPRSVLEEIGLT